MAEKAYSVQAAAQEAGISPHTLRTWELRYRMVSPIRTASGHRRYLRADVEKLMAVSALVRRGHPISAIANLSLAELHNFTAFPAPDVASQSLDLGFSKLLHPEAQKRLDSLKARITTYDPAGLAADIKWLRTVLGARSFVLDAGVPLFAFVAKQVETGEIDIGSEHLFSAIIRDQISDMLHTLISLSQFDRDTKSRRSVSHLFATPENDHHEFGVLLGATLAASNGLNVCYAGPNLPAATLAHTAKAFTAEVIVLGNSPIPPNERKVSFKDYLLELDEALQKAKKRESAIWVGGQGDRPVRRLPSGRQLIYLNSMRDLDSMLCVEK